MKKLLAFVGLLILIVPTILAVKFYNDALVEESLRERLVRIEVTDNGGQTYTYSADDSDKSKKEPYDLLASLKALTEKSMYTREELALMAGNSDESNENPKCVLFSVRYFTNHNEYSAEIFVTDTDRNGNFVAYIASSAGVYCFDDVSKNTLLSCEFAYTVYDSASLPVLTVGENEISHLTATWKIRTSAGSFADVMCPDGHTESADGFTTALSFSVSPDAATVKVTDEDGNELYNGDLAAFASFSADRSGTLTVEVNALWYQASDRNYYGNVVYRFTSNVTADPKFVISANEVQPGGTLLLSCLNIPEDKIAVAAVGDTAVPLYRNGANLYAFVPFSYNTVPGNYTIDIAIGEDMHKVFVTVTEKNFIKTASVPTRLMSADRIIAATTEASVGEYKALLKSVAAGASETFSYDGSLLDFQKSFDLYKGYGLYIPFEASGSEIRNDGVYFTAKAGSIVEAMGNGKVVAVGECSYLGKYIVIDHGYGLRSWYATLGELSVAVGDTVTKGDTIGKVGEGGVAPSTTMLIIITVGETPVSPYVFWESVRNFEK